MTASSGRLRPNRSAARFVVSMLVLSLSLVLPAATGAGAQGTGLTSDTTYVTSTGETISWAAPWALALDGIRTTAQYDMVVLTDGTASVVVGIGSFAVEAARDFLLFSLGADTEAATALDEGTTGDIAYQFDLLPINGVGSGVFTLVASGPAVTMTMYISPVPSSAAGMTIAQIAIAIDGAPVFAGIGGDGLQAQLEAAALPASTSPPSTTPAADDATDRAVTVASSTITYGAGWEYEVTGSTPGEVAMFADVADMPAQTTFAIIGVMPFAASDPTPWLQMFDDAFCTEAGVTDAGPLAVQQLPSGNAWGLRVVDTMMPPLVMLSYADVTTDPGEIRLMVLMTDATDVPATLADAQASIQIDGAPTFAELDATMVQAQLDGSAGIAPSETPSPADRRDVPLPDRGSMLPTMPAATTTPAPVSDSGQTVTVGNTVVSWTGSWQYDAISSMDEQATLNQVDPGAGTLKLATYGEFIDPTVGTPDAALEAFAAAFFDGAQATAVVNIGSGQLDDGTVWKVYTMNLQGLQLTFLITVSQTPGGEYIVSTLTGNSDQFASTIAQAQAEILLDGQPVFLAGIDPQVVLGPGA